jgi:hypothetical protein
MSSSSSGLHPVVSRVNSLLSRSGLPRAVRTTDELSANASSLLVASFEAVFSSAIADIRRRPGAAAGPSGGGGGSAAADHAFNAQRVIDSLSALLPPRVAIPATVTGAAVASGDLAAFAFLISILDEASRAIQAAGDGAAAGAAAAVAAASTDNNVTSKSVLSSLGETSLAAATAYAEETRTSFPAPSANASKADVSWLAHAAVGAEGSDIWSSTTPAKLRERDAVKSALLGGAPRSPAAPPAPPTTDRSSSASLSASAAAAYRAKRAGPGGEGILAANMKEEDDHRRAEAAKLAERRAKGLMTRMAHNAASELAQIQVMTKTAVREREVELRAIEARALAAATARAKAAKHERKVLTMRTKLVIENLSRQTLSMRIARSSRQAAATSTLLKALAGQARLGAADKLHAAASERASMLVDASARVAWLNHTSRMLNEVMLEETARQVAQRQAATRSQKEALDRAIREMSLDEDALLRRMQAEQAHAEEAFLATHIEPMELKSAGADGARVASQRLNDPTDTDNDVARVDTLARAHRVLASGSQKVAASRGAADRTIQLIAKDVGLEIAEADALEEQGKRYNA